MKFLSFLSVIIVCLPLSVSAEMMQCTAKKNNHRVAHFFDSGDKKSRKLCTDRPVPYVTSTGKKINSHYKKPTPKPKVIELNNAMAEQVAKTPKCGGSGGTIKANGKVFHLDPVALCRKYGVKNKGSITHGKARHVKLSRVAANFRKKIAPFVNEMAKKYGMEPEFIHAVISAESAYRPNATSSAGAMGLMQLMPFTAERFGVSNAYNPEKNVNAGTKYLRELYDEFGSLELAAAGYNAGEGAVRKYHNSIPPFKETQAYVPRVMMFYRRYKKNPALISLQ